MTSKKPAEGETTVRCAVDFSRSAPVRAIEGGQENLSKFGITVARIEAAARGEHDEQVRITFQVESAPSQFQIPILLSIADFDDTEVLQAARSALHQTFVEPAAHSQRWKLTPHDLQQLSSMSLRGARRAPRGDA